MKPLFVGILFLSFFFAVYTKSACEEKSQSLTGEDQCKGLTTENSNETCCYLSGTSEGDEHGVECVDMRKDDAFTEEGLEKAKKQIIDAKYWTDYTTKYFQIDKIICYDGEKKVEIKSSVCESIQKPEG